ncbi:MAG: shikimate kinase [Burkholderiales bacterium]|nr:shikimate kinase [Burkholderiales bacterium]
MIALVGMPGSGKSTVGRHLARQIGWRFADSDVEIERELGESIRSYFEKAGEDSFRSLETSVLASLLERPSMVLATGGGAVLREANRKLLSEHAKVVYLRATPEDLARRLRHDTQRPLLQGGDPLRKLRDLFLVRDPLYREVANFTIDTGRTSVPTLVNLLTMQLEMAGVIEARRT